MKLETIQLIVYLVSLALTLIGLLLTLLSRSKNVKLKKIASKSLEVLAFCQDAVELAEGLTNFTGEEKKEYAMTQVMKLCIRHGIEIDEEEISSDIERIIDISKKINKREEKKTVSTESQNQMRIENGGL